MPGMKTIQQMRDELLLAGGGAVKAPVTKTGFYSPLEEAALNIQRKSGNAQAFMNDLRTVPKEHLQHAGVDKLLTSRPTITREELQQHIAQAAPKVEVKVKRHLDSWRDRFDELVGRGYQNLSPAERREHDELSARWDREGESPPLGEADTKYNQYTLPGGQNYREVLLTLGEREPTPEEIASEFQRMYGSKESNPLRLELARKYAKQRTATGQAGYLSSHWQEPNVLAHFRINDRTDKDGKKVLFVEELQSDWGQEGKKKGFSKEVDRAAIEARMQEITARLRQIAKAVTPEQVPAMEAEWNRLSDEKSSLADSLVKAGQGVPSAPFVTKTNDWVNLALKHILKMAAEEGHDRVAFVRGEQAADRFGLDKHFSRVAARPTPTGGYQLQTTMKDGSREDSVDVPPNKLHEYVGQDLAEKIHAQGGGVFEGGDLKMPQMGMRKFYDELVPAQAQGLIKRFGGQMGTVQVPLEPKGLSWPSAPQKYSEHPGFDITPEMRQAILKPMSYKVGGSVPAMDAMRLQVWNKRRGR